MNEETMLLVEAVADKTAERVLDRTREERAAEREGFDRAMRQAWTEDLGKLRDELTVTGLLKTVPGYVDTSKKAAHVLVVDDYPAFLKVIGDRLEQSGLTVLRADTTHSAVEHLEEDPAIEVAVVDATIQKNGYTLLEHIREHHRGIQVIMTSGREIDPQKARELGAFGFLAKPFDLGPAVLMIERAAEFRRMRLAAGLRE